MLDSHLRARNKILRQFLTLINEISNSKHLNKFAIRIAFNYLSFQEAFYIAIINSRVVILVWKKIVKFSVGKKSNHPHIISISCELLDNV